MRVRSRCSARGGFSLVEATLAIAVLSIVGAATLISTSSSIRSADAAVEQTIADGLAEQLLDEMAGLRWGAAGASPYQTPLGPNSWEQGGTGRERFDDIDDFQGMDTVMSKDLWGFALATENGEGGQRNANLRLRSNYFNTWSRTCSVYYVSESNPTVKLTGSSTSNLRCAEVNVHVTENSAKRTISTRRRIFAYVPMP